MPKKRLTKSESVLQTDSGENFAFGDFTLDALGELHYRHNSTLSTVYSAAQEALRQKRRKRPGSKLWFWYQETPAPILKRDTLQKLVRRWEIWNELYNRIA